GRPDGRVERGRFWNLKDVAAEGRERARAGEQPDLAAIVEESTRRHLLSDVPVATFLSGGLDSSYLTALAARHQPGISAYTIGFRAEDARFEAMPDDLRYARQVAEQFGVDLHEIEIAPNVLDLLPQMTHHLDEPIGDPAAINTFLICSAAREAGVKVMLSGMGADELFAGYRKHLANLLALRYQRVPRLVRKGLSAAVSRLPVATSRRGFLPGLNLAYTDRSSMAASTEVRVPFVDVEVVKAAFSLPGSRKIAGRQGKAALKEAAASILPSEIVYRPKGLFSAPLRAWMSRD